MIQFHGLADQAARFLQKEQLSDPALWSKFVETFRVQEDGENQGWRGEFWGKMMRGGALVCAYTQDPGLYQILTDSVKDMMTAAEPDGRVSTYTRETEFDSWDLWSRKYVILACEYYLEICKDESLKKEIIQFISRCADYIIDHIGPGKKSITSASRSWYGINSSSILEPIVRLYKLTANPKYLDFATYIVEHGGAENINIFELAYENKLYPYQYGVSKAYEMTSCFEGLLEYYYVTGIEKYKTAVINYAQAVLDSEISIIGSCGVTHELFDHTRTRQTVRYDGVMQETCVTVTWMKFCSRLLELTGESIYADAMEQSFYNAYLGAFNTERKECPYVYEKFIKKMGYPRYQPTFLPLDSYSPLTPGKRGQKIGGSQILHDLSYYGCCACIAAAGVGVFLQKAVTADENSITVNFFENGTAEAMVGETPVTLRMETAYPTDGKIRLTVEAEKPVTFTLKLRNPGWSEGPKGYALYTKEWSRDTVELSFEMPLKLHYPEHWEKDLVYTDTSKNSAGFHCALAEKVYHKPEEDHYVAVTRGPLTLAADSRTGKPADSVFDIKPEAAPVANEIIPGVDCLLKLEFTAENGEKFYLVDYSSAGRDWETTIAAWMPTK
ncbi:MAG: glycoside hydrolase family 127 protein [Clostridia bacterium]|nr:glycoside hydrolase family 127 protein [Clostridia bacterium]